MKKKSKLGQVTIKVLAEAVDWARGYRFGRMHAAELADAVLRAHGASKVVRKRMAKALVVKEDT